MEELKLNEFIDEMRLKDIKKKNELRSYYITNNHLRGRNYAAGILPTAIKEETGEPYFLLGLNAKKHFSVFWGWQDKGDLDCQFTACREAVEEGLECFGDFETLRSALSSHNSSEMIFNFCFMVFLGKISNSKMEEICEKYKHSR